MGALVKSYLIIYNFVLALGWVYVLYRVLEHSASHKTVYSVVRIPLQVFQTAALFEIVHAATGIVQSNAILTAFQIFSRVFQVWAVLELSPPSIVSIGLPLLLYAWSVTEIIRYGYYFLHLVGYGQLLVWFRYTFFIVLYPVGITGELICLYHAIIYDQEKRIWSQQFPSNLHFLTDHFYVFVFLGILVYIPVAPRLYCHMLTQRSKMLGNNRCKMKVKSQ